jgi:hypothetical protein
MTDFKAKHRELYLEELKELLKQYNECKKVDTKNFDLYKNDIFPLNKLFDLINKFNLSDKGEVLLILKILKSNLSEEDFRTICIYEFNDYSTNSLHKIVYKIFKDHLIDIILESRYAK